MMTKILERYITKIIFSATGLASLIILGVLALVIVTKELKNLGEGSYDLLQVAIYVLLRLPNELYQFSPLLILLGTIMGLSVLTSHRELAVMRALGFSMRQIIMTVLTAGLLLILIISLIGESIGPNLSYKAEMGKESAQNGGQAVITASGVWFHVDDNFIHVKRVVGRQLLEGVTRYQFDKNRRLQAAYYAKTLSYKNKTWQMNNVVKTTFFPERTKSESFVKAPWDLMFNPNLLNVGLVEPNQMSLFKLAKLSQYLEQNGLQSSEYRFDFWKRLFQPFASLVMVFLAIPFVLGAFSTATLGLRMLAGVLVGIIFFILNALLGQLCIVFQLPAILAAFLPPALFAIVGVYLARRLAKG